MLKKTVIVSDTETIIVEHKTSFNITAYTAWLLRDGKAVAMVRYLGYDDKGMTVLSDIEVRASERGHQLGLYFINLVREHLLDGAVMYTSGHYTPEGYRSLSHALPMTPAPDGYDEDPHVAFNSMTFVHDWDERLLK